MSFKNEFLSWFKSKQQCPARRESNADSQNSVQFDNINQPDAQGQEDTSDLDSLLAPQDQANTTQQERENQEALTKFSRKSFPVQVLGGGCFSFPE